MEEIISFHKKLNIKKLIICISIILLILVFFINLIFFSNKETVQTIINPNTIFMDTQNSMSIELSKNYNLSLHNSNTDYILEAKSPYDLQIFISHTNLLKEHQFKEIVYADKQVFCLNFENVSDISEILEKTINDKKIFTYNFKYIDSTNSQQYYIEIIWIKTELGYYIVDIKYPVSNSANYTNLSTELLNSFQLHT